MVRGPFSVKNTLAAPVPAADRSSVTLLSVTPSATNTVEPFSNRGAELSVTPCSMPPVLRITSSAPPEV